MSEKWREQMNNQISKTKIQKAGEGGCLNVEAIEQEAYN